MIQKLVACVCGEPVTAPELSARQETALKTITDNIIFYSGNAYEWASIHEAFLEAIYVHGVRVAIIDVLGDVDIKMKAYNTSFEVMDSIKSLLCGDVEDNRPPVAIMAAIHTVKVGGVFEEEISLASVEGGKNIITQLTCAVAIDGTASDITPTRGLRLIKKPRMREAQIHSCFIQYKNKEYRYEQK